MRRESVIFFSQNHRFDSVADDVFLIEFNNSIRAYLKTVKTPKQRLFFPCAAPFSLEIHPVFLQKNGLHREKIPRCWSFCQFSDTA